MSDLNHDLHARAVNALSENEVRKMEHCVGFDRKKIYHRGGTAYYKEVEFTKVIRCKDCAEWKVIKMRSGIKKNYCGKIGCVVEEDDFCSKAEPKETEHV